MESSNLWSSVIGQKDAIDKISSSLHSDEGSHAWLFTGPKGIGKWTTAKVMAAVLNCENDGCGLCPSCGKVLREIHPDVFFIEPEGNYIVVDQVKQIHQAANLKNFEGKTKVIIIDEADRLTPEGANSLLKILEEPPPDLVFILITSNLEAALPTIISRCRQVSFKSIPLREMTSFLIYKYNLSYDEAALATKLSGGVLGVAISFATSIAKKERRNTILKIAQGIGGYDPAKLTFVAEDLIKEIKKPQDELKGKHKAELASLKDQYGLKDIPSHTKKRLEQRHKRELNREEHQGFEEILSILASWFRDIVLEKETGRDDLLTNQDHILAIKEYADVLTSADVYKCLQIIEEVKQYLRFNVNMQLALETLLFKIHDVVALQSSPY